MRILVSGKGEMNEICQEEASCDNGRLIWKCSSNRSTRVGEGTRNDLLTENYLFFFMRNKLWSTVCDRKYWSTVCDL